MKAYRMLLWRELREAAPTAGAYLLGTILWIVFLYSRSGHWNPGVILAMAEAPLVALPLWALWRVYHGLQRDFGTRHAHLILSLPVPGWQPASAKLLIIWAEVALVLAVGVAGLVKLVLYGGLPPINGELPPEWMSTLERTLVTGTAALGTLLLFTVVPAWLVLGQLSWLGGRMFRRAQGIVGALVFVAGAWLFIRAGMASAWLLGWLPKWKLIPYPDLQWIPTTNTWEVATRFVSVPPGPIIATVALALLLFLIGARRLERALDLAAHRPGPAAALVAWFLLTALDVYLSVAGLYGALLRATA